MNQTELNNDFEYCAKIQKQHGKSYYFATKFFPYDKRNATYALYAWMRLPDEIVDSNLSRTKADIIQDLKNWEEAWYLAYHKKNSTHPVLRAASYVFHTYDIPFSYSKDFLAAMTMDLTKRRYQTYEDLRKYMYGSAAVVGLMMSHIIGFEKGALLYAEKLGYAMQLTNFLRDIHEDYTERGRIYLPEDELKEFGLKSDDFAAGKFTEDSRSFIRFMQFQIERARSLYKEADQGIRHLNPDGRLAVRLASVIYGAILGKIEDANYNVFTQRVATSTFEKIILATKTYIKHGNK